MGYYTRFDLTKASSPDFAPALEKAIDVDPFGDSMKWYDHDDDIKAAMIATGTERVEIHGIGEEQGDVWDKEYTLDLVSKRVAVRCAKYQLVRGEWT
jgi:hypothetical protein